LSKKKHRICSENLFCKPIGEENQLSTLALFFGQAHFRTLSRGRSCGVPQLAQLGDIGAQCVELFVCCFIFPHHIVLEKQKTSCGSTKRAYKKTRYARAHFFLPFFQYSCLRPLRLSFERSGAEFRKVRK
jgi:hypothetical protein